MRWDGTVEDLLVFSGSSCQTHGHNIYKGFSKAFPRKWQILGGRQNTQEHDKLLGFVPGRIKFCCIAIHAHQPIRVDVQRKAWAKGPFNMQQHGSQYTAQFHPRLGQVLLCFVVFGCFSFSLFAIVHALLSGSINLALPLVHGNVRHWSRAFTVH